jgi:hypothetical protein
MHGQASFQVKTLGLIVLSACSANTRTMEMDASPSASTAGSPTHASSASPPASSAPALAPESDALFGYLIDHACTESVVSDAKAAAAMPDGAEAEIHGNDAAIFFKGERKLLEDWLAAYTPPKRRFVIASRSYEGPDGKLVFSGWRAYCREDDKLFGVDDLDGFAGFEGGGLGEFMVKFTLKPSAIEHLANVAADRTVVFASGRNALGTAFVRALRNEKASALHFLEKPTSVPGGPSISWSPFVFGK